MCVFVFLCYMFSYFDNSVCYAFCVLVFVVFLRFSSLCIVVLRYNVFCVSVIPCMCVYVVHVCLCV